MLAAQPARPPASPRPRPSEEDRRNCLRVTPFIGLASVDSRLLDRNREEHTRPRTACQTLSGLSPSKGRSGARPGKMKYGGGTVGRRARPRRLIQAFVSKSGLLTTMSVSCEYSAVRVSLDAYTSRVSKDSI